MPTDRYGRVIVSPYAPLGMEDFAQLYTNEGSTPDEAASNIYWNYPAEAQTALKEQWRRLEPRKSPEQYFSELVAARQFAPIANPVTARRGVPGIAPPMGSAAGPPTAAGAYPSAVTPSGHVWPHYRDAMLATAAPPAEFTPEEVAHPILSAATPDEVLAAQLAGDRTGDVKQFLQRHQGLDPEAQINLPSTIRAPLEPYISHTGIGYRGFDQFDQALYEDKEFQKILRSDPKRAAHVYKTLLGRDMTIDATAHKEVLDKRQKTGSDFAGRQLAMGAKFDRLKQRWMVRHPIRTEGLLGTGTGQEVGEGDYSGLVPATPDEEAWMDTHYTPLTGRTNPRINSPITDQIRANKPLADRIRETGAQSPEEIKMVVDDWEQAQSEQRHHRGPIDLSGTYLENLRSKWYEGTKALGGRAADWYNEQEQATIDAMRAAGSFLAHPMRPGGAP